MPYEYRKLSPAEREQAVEERIRRGYPLHQPPHPFREQGTYLITAANFEHVSIMDSPERRTEFQKLLLASLRNVKAEISGWGILSNHYHVLTVVESLDCVSDVLKQVHGSTSHRWNKEDGLTGKRKVWYRFSDRMIRDEVHFNHALNYIHYNPVKHGLVKDIYEWPWSSLFMYVDNMGRDWLRENWKKYTPAADFGKGWDT